MANHPSAEKRNRQRIKRTDRNRAVKSSVRTFVKKVRTEVAGGDTAKAKVALQEAIQALDSAASKGVYHPKAASRTVGRLSAAVHKLATGGAAAPAASTAKKAAPKKAAPKAKKPAAKKA